MAWTATVGLLSLWHKVCLVLVLPQHGKSCLYLVQFGTVQTPYLAGVKVHVCDPVCLWLAQVWVLPVFY